MNKKIILGIIICAVCVSFCGCSWVQSISDEDMKSIATYSAKMVAKYNVKQIDGVVHIDEYDVLQIADEQAKEEAKKQKAANTTNSTKSNSSNSTNNATATKTPVPLSTALGISGVDFKYQGQEVKDSYANAVYDMSPGAGNKFLVMKFKVTNTSGGDTKVDVLSLNPKFKATLNGASTATNDLSLMPEDLSTYQGTLKAGESKDLIILFQFKSEDLANIQSVSLQCTAKGSTNDITL
ncbi:MAG: hypothetical protein K5644_02895 [Lachnospiraceae bacterium]|nr:hypothetical protein [Lachnospiraceae bacterium]